MIFLGPRPKRYTDLTSDLRIKVKRKEYAIYREGEIVGDVAGGFKEVDEITRRSKGRRDVITFPLSVIHDPSSFRWNVSVPFGEEGDSLPNYPKPGYRTFKVVPKDPPKSGGRTNLKFKIPKNNWKPGSKVAVTVCSSPAPPAAVQCARKTSKVFKPKPPKLPVLTIKFRGGKGSIPLTCRQSKTCRGKIEIKRGKRALVKKQRYSIAAHVRKKVKLRLTKAGKKALGKSRRVRATGTLTGKSGTKARIVAILKRG